jgi:hypothetical protein
MKKRLANRSQTRLHTGIIDAVAHFGAGFIGKFGSPM